MEIKLLDNQYASLNEAVEGFRNTLSKYKESNPSKYTDNYISSCLKIATSIKTVIPELHSSTIEKNSTANKKSTFAKVIENSMTLGMMQVQSFTVGNISTLWIAELAGCNHGGEKLLTYAINEAIKKDINVVKLSPANHDPKLIDYYNKIVTSKYLEYRITVSMEDDVIVYRLLT